MLVCEGVRSCGRRLAILPEREHDWQTVRPLHTDVHTDATI